MVDWTTDLTGATRTGTPGALETETLITAPTGLAVAPADTQNTITFDAVSGATGYNLYWSTTNPVTKEDNKLSGISSGYTHSGLTNGTQYYYVVTAYDATTESDASSQVNGTPVSSLTIDTLALTFTTYGIDITPLLLDTLTLTFQTYEITATLFERAAVGALTSLGVNGVGPAYGAISDKEGDPWVEEALSSSVWTDVSTSSNTWTDV